MLPVHTEGVLFIYCSKNLNIPMGNGLMHERPGEKRLVIMDIKGVSIVNIAIVTGASSGLGREYARLLDNEGLDEIWLISRHKDKLTETAEKLKTKSRILPMDLTNSRSYALFETVLQEEQPVVSWFIHAAGFGRMGSVKDMPETDTAGMIAIHCEAAVSLTKAVLPYGKKGSHIVEICSCAAFQPLPYLAVYAACKAFLLRYSRALSEELKPEGISVSAVCPYWIKDTDFIASAKRTDRKNIFRHYILAGSCKNIACRSFRQIRNGKTVITPDFMSTLDRFGSWIIPQRLLLHICRLFR